MPQRIGTPCNHRGCPAIVVDRYCDEHRRQHVAQVNARRDTSLAKLYKSARWARARAAFLASNPYCVHCLEHPAAPSLVAARHVDHIRPHRGDVDLFWDQTNWQPLCASCHSRKTAQENGGFGNG